MCASRWQPLPGLIWIAGAPVWRECARHLAGLLVALDHCDALLPEHFDGLDSNVVLPEPGLEPGSARKCPRSARRCRFRRIGVVFFDRMSCSICTMRLLPRPGAWEWREHSGAGGRADARGPRLPRVRDVIVLMIVTVPVPSACTCSCS